MKKTTINVQGAEIRLFEIESSDFISLTDIAKKFNEQNPSFLIVNWMRNRDTIEFLGVWEQLNNPSFNLIEFDKVKKSSGTNRFILSTGKWIKTTNAIGIQSKAGRYGGTYAHKDIALAFCYWLSPPFQLYILKEFQRLKQLEAANEKEQLDWNIKRVLAKVNYRIHTDAVKEFLIPPRLKNTSKEGIIYASEADLLNKALFGHTAKEWRAANSGKKGNMRDDATTEQLLVLANLENLNATFITDGHSQGQRLDRLNEIAIYQLKLLLRNEVGKKLKN